MPRFSGHRPHVHRFIIFYLKALGWPRREAAAMLAGVCPFGKSTARDRAWLWQSDTLGADCGGAGAELGPTGLSGALRVRGADVGAQPRVFFINSFISDVK